MIAVLTATYDLVTHSSVSVSVETVPVGMIIQRVIAQINNDLTDLLCDKDSNSPF